MITICFTYFRSLTLAHLRAALYTVAKQNLASVKELIVLDNNTDDTQAAVARVIEEATIRVPHTFLSSKHGDRSKTHSWSTNRVVREATTPWVLFTRADFLLDSQLLSRFAGIIKSKPAGWNGFISSYGVHLPVDIGVCEQTTWREEGIDVLQRFGGNIIDYNAIDSGVWMARRNTFQMIGGLDEDLTAWGHAQTLFQYRMYEAGVEFVNIPDVLYAHPLHAAERDLELAHAQLQQKGLTPQTLWERYLGAKPY